MTSTPEDPLVSISCITYNHENYIRDALDGFLMQKTNFKFEILIHDDASTDGTAEIIREYEAKYPLLLKPIYQTENQWIKGKRGSVVFNFPRAKGKYIALCEGDDYWTDPLKLQKQVDFMEAHKEFTFCCHRYRVKIEKDYNGNMKRQARLNDNGDEMNNEIAHEYYNGSDVEIDYNLFFKTWLTQPATTVFRASYVNELMDFSKHFTYYRDVHLFYFLLGKGKGVSLNQFMATYRRHEGGIESGASEIQSLVLRRKLWKEMYQYNSLDDNLRNQYLRAGIKLFTIENRRDRFYLYFELLLVANTIKYFLKINYHFLKNF